MRLGSVARRGLAIATVMAGACLPAVAQVANPGPGLPGLLNQPNWKEPPPLPPAPDAGFEPPAPDAPPQRDVVGELRNEIGDRNRRVDQTRLFETVEKLQQQQVELGRRNADLVKANQRIEQALAEVRRLAVPGVEMAVTKDQIANATRELQNARAAARGPAEEFNKQAKVVQDLQNEINKAAGPWRDSYVRMRQAIRPDRRDPNRDALLGVLEPAIAARNDFVEGRVLAAFLHVYGGNADAADKHLQEALTFIDKHDLNGALVEDDAVYAYLLLGQSNKVANQIAGWAGLKAKHVAKTGLHCWLVGLGGMLNCRDTEARQHMASALDEFGFKEPKNRNRMPFETTPLLGDAALFWLTANAKPQRNVDQARKILARTDPAWDVWQLARARAALAAEDRDWAEALEQLSRCRDACPPALDAEIAEQRQAYANRQPWVRPRPDKKVAAIP